MVVRGMDNNIWLVDSDIASVCILYKIPEYRHVERVHPTSEIRANPGDIDGTHVRYIIPVDAVPPPMGIPV